MSIIHEALKKAEREREPRPQRLPLYGGVRTAPSKVALAGVNWHADRPDHGRGREYLAVAALPQGGTSRIRTARPMAQNSPAVALGGEDQAALQMLSRSPTVNPAALVGGAVIARRRRPLSLRTPPH